MSNFYPTPTLCATPLGRGSQRMTLPSTASRLALLVTTGSRVRPCLDPFGHEFLMALPDLICSLHPSLSCAEHPAAAMARKFLFEVHPFTEPLQVTSHRTHPPLPLVPLSTPL